MAIVSDERHRKELVTRLKRIEGQLRGIQAMIEAAEDCEKIVQQVSASRRALDKVFFNVLACAIQSEGAPAAGGKPAERRLRQAAELLAKYG
jgi:DNA-binding FrmR family transcriptional regulator